MLKKGIDLVLFLTEIDIKIQDSIVRAIDFTSMEIGNSKMRDINHISHYVYRRTKKDVFEYKKIQPADALMDQKVIEFVFLYEEKIFSEYHGVCMLYSDVDIVYLKKYFEICRNYMQGR